MRQFLREAKDSNTNVMHTLPVAMTAAFAGRGERSPTIQSTSLRNCLITYANFRETLKITFFNVHK